MVAPRGTPVGHELIASDRATIADTRPWSRSIFGSRLADVQIAPSLTHLIRWQGIDDVKPCKRQSMRRKRTGSFLSRLFEASVDVRFAD